MRVLIATDAWHPQVNGVVRTLTSLAAAARALDVEIDFLTPEGFRSWPLPTYPGLRIALPSGKEIARRIEKAAPEALHIGLHFGLGRALDRGHAMAECGPVYAKFFYIINDALFLVVDRLRPHIESGPLFGRGLQDRGLGLCLGFVPIVGLQPCVRCACRQWY